MKTLALIARKPGLARDEFRAHYEAKHVPLALPLLSGLLHYVRHHVRETLWGEVGFDVVTSFRYRDAAALRSVMARLESPAGDALLRDELRFMDKARNRFFAVRELEERGTRDRAAALQCIALVRRAPQEAPAVATGPAIPALYGAVDGVRWSLRQEALARFGEPPWDAVVQLHADADAGLAGWCAAREREGARVALVRVSEHETLLPPGGIP